MSIPKSAVPYKECHAEIRRWDRAFKELSPGGKHYEKLATLQRKIKNSKKRLWSDTGDYSAVSYIEVSDKDTKELITLYKNVCRILEKNENTAIAVFEKLNLLQTQRNLSSSSTSTKSQKKIKNEQQINIENKGKKRKYSHIDNEENVNNNNNEKNENNNNNNKDEEEEEEEEKVDENFQKLNYNKNNNLKEQNLIETNQPLPKNKNPGPLCGAIPADENYIIPSGALVAACTRKPKNMAVWLLANIVRYIPGKNRYEVIDADPDEDVHSRKHYTLTKQSLIPLPTSIPEQWTKATQFSKGQIVLAMFPTTTCFYRARVVSSPRQRKSNDYALIFDDDEDDDDDDNNEGTKCPTRYVDPRYVLKYHD